MALSILAFLVYLLTLSRTVQAGDAGELATVSATLGIAHPTGYPLFTLLGRVVSTLPAGDARIILKLNAFSALCVAVSVFFFHRAFMRLFSRPAALAAFAAAGSFAFSRTVWSEAVSFEVYSLHLLLLSVILVLFLQALERPGSERAWLLFAYVLGLGFTHHLLTGLLAPAFLYLYFAPQGRGFSAWIRIAKSVPAFMLGLSPYLYLPIRAAADPRMNWGDPSNLVSFWYHVSAGQYRFKMFASFSTAWDKAADFAASVPAEFGYAPLLLGALGLIAAFGQHRGQRRPGIFITLLALAGMLYGWGYGFKDPDFYLIVWVAFSACVGLGVRRACAFADSEGRASKWLATSACAVAILWPIAFNYRHADASQDRAAEDFARNLLVTSDSGALLISDLYPLSVSPAYYLQEVEGVRRDVLVVGEGMLGMPWYSSRLEGLPAILSRSQGLQVSGDSRAVLQNLFQENFGKRPVTFLGDAYEVLPWIQVPGGESLEIAPDGLVVRFYSGQPPILQPKEFSWSSFASVPESQNAGEQQDELSAVERPAVIRKIRYAYALGYANQGIYRILSTGDTLQGKRLLRKALAVEPGFPPAVQALTEF
jgi:hypothetical protein